MHILSGRETNEIGEVEAVGDHEDRSQFTLIVSVVLAHVVVVESLLFLLCDETPHPVLPAVVAAVAGLAFCHLGRLTKTVVAPAAIITSGIAVVAVVGEQAWPGVVSVAAVSYRATVDPTALEYGRNWMLVAALGVYLGAIATALVMKRSTDTQDGWGRGVRISTTLSVAAIVFGILANLVTRTPDTYWQRSHYLDANGLLGASTLSHLWILVSMFLLGSLCGSRRLPQVWGWFFTGVYFLLCLGHGSRILTLAPLAFFTGYLLVPREEGESRTGRIWLVGGLSGLTSLLFLNLILKLRTLESTIGAGIYPALNAIRNDWSVLLSIDLKMILGNVLFSVPLVGEVYTSASPYPKGALAVALSPLPGSAVGWPQLSPKLAIAAFTPYSGIAELSKNGVLVTLAVCAVFGIATTFIQLSSKNFSPLFQMPVVVLSYGLGFLSMVNLLQYNLRSGVRFLWYALLFMLMLKVLDVVVGKTDSTDGGDGGEVPGR